MLLPWCAKLSSLRYPVLPIPEFAAIFLNIVHAMDANSVLECPASELDNLFAGLKDSVVDLVTARLREIPPAGRS